MRSRRTRLSCAAILATLAACDEGPPIDARVVSAVERGPIERPASVRARDRGYSGVVGGKLVLAFGDTVLAAPNQEGDALQTSSWSWTADLDAGDGLAGLSQALDPASAPQRFIPLRASEATFNQEHRPEGGCTVDCTLRMGSWPGPIVEDVAGGRTLAFYTRGQMRPGSFNQSPTGSGIGVLTAPDQPATNTDAEVIFLYGKDPLVGAAAVIDGDYLYAWACANRRFVVPCILARGPLADLGTRAAWRFYAGQEGGTAKWSEGWRDGVGVTDAAMIFSVHWSPFLSRFVAVYSALNGDEVLMRTALRPEGPWSSAERLFTGERGYADGAYDYSAIAHPALARDGGRVEYVTYFRSTGASEGELRLVEVTLAPR